jgi:hypothetical protein
MELLLNIVWLTLALPAIWMWRHESVCPGDSCRLHRIRPFLLFTCVLVLLFPVISATDDLHAMRQEIEESGPSKRMVKQAAGDKSDASANVSCALSAWVSPVPVDTNDQVCGRVVVISVVLPQQARATERASRAPPFASFNGSVSFAA